MEFYGCGCARKKGKTFPVETGKWTSPLPWLCLWSSAPKPVLAALHSSAQKNQAKSHRESSGTLKSMLEGSYQVRSSTGKCVICLLTASLTKGRGYRLAMFPQLHTDLPLQRAKQLQERLAFPSMPSFSLVFFSIFLHLTKRKKIRICVFFFTTEVSQDCWTGRKETTCSPNNWCSAYDSEMSQTLILHLMKASPSQEDLFIPAWTLCRFSLFGAFLSLFLKQ